MTACARTIANNPNQFFAFNNGLTATAEEVETTINPEKKLLGDNAIIEPSNRKWRANNCIIEVRKRRKQAGSRSGFCTNKTQCSQKP